MSCLRSSQATSRTKFKDGMWLEACSEWCGKNLAFQKLVFVFLFVHFPQVMKISSSDAFSNGWGRKKKTTSFYPKACNPNLEVKFITPNLQNFITIISQPKESLMQRGPRCNIHPRSTKKTTDGKMFVGFGVAKIWGGRLPKGPSTLSIESIDDGFNHWFFLGTHFKFGSWHGFQVTPCWK